MLLPFFPCARFFFASGRKRKGKKGIKGRERANGNNGNDFFTFLIIVVEDVYHVVWKCAISCR